MGNFQCLLRKGLEEVASPHGKCASKFDNVFQSYVALAPLHTANIVPMESGALREFFLGIPALFSQSAYGLSEERLRGSFGHPLMLGF